MVLRDMCQAMKSMVLFSSSRHLSTLDDNYHWGICHIKTKDGQILDANFYIQEMICIYDDNPAVHDKPIKLHVIRSWLHVRHKAQPHTAMLHTHDGMY